MTDITGPSTDADRPETLHQGRIASFLTARGFISQVEVTTQIADLMATALRSQMQVIKDEPDSGCEEGSYNRGCLITFLQAYETAMGNLDAAMNAKLGRLPIFSANAVANQEKYLVEHYYALESAKLQILRKRASSGEQVDEDAIEEQTGAVDAWANWFSG